MAESFKLSESVSGIVPQRETLLFTMSKENRELQAQLDDLTAKMAEVLS
jgi:hypothetical protein